MVYYTPEFAAATDDIEEFIDKMIEETNQGYINSKLPITVTKFCSELASISEHCVDPNSLLEAFLSMKGSYWGGHWNSDWGALRNTADAATLLVLNHKDCGQGCYATYNHGDTFSWVKKDCAIRWFTLGHELGHNLGAGHNIEAPGRVNFRYGRGHLIEKGKYYTGLNTIMAYPRQGHEIRTNYYSNPDVIHPLTGTPTGERSRSNNAAVIWRNIAKLAAIGDESGSCKTLSFNWRDPFQLWRKMTSKLSAATGKCLMTKGWNK